MANLAYGVTTTRDPQTSTPDVFAYADMVDAGMMPGPRIYATGPGVFVGVRHRGSRRGVPLHQALQGGLPHQHAQAVRRRRSHRPAVDHRGVQGVRHHGDDRRLARPQAEPDADGRRLLRPGAQLADHAALQGRRRVRRADEDVLHADDPRRLRRAVDARTTGSRTRTRSTTPKLRQLDSVGAARHDDAPPRAVVPARGVRPHADRARASPTSCTPADAPGSAATARCRGSARTGKRGTSRRAG